ncbi:MAG: hypothetical protein ACK4YP_19545, partial [Myxococcota bacterium]
STLFETSRDGGVDLGGALESGAAKYEPDIDGAAPAAMALALEVGPESGLVNKGRGRVVVLGDADALGNGLLSEGPGNASFAINTFRWLLGDEGRLSVVGRPSAVRRLALSQDDLGKVRWLVLSLGPLLAVVLGAGVWASRRGR